MGQKNPILKPFLKWAGGKRQLLPELIKYQPSGFSKGKNTYYEPFVGAGAFLFKLQPEKAVINDKNKELINCYKIVQSSVDELIEELKKYQDKNNESDYYNIRFLDRNKTEYSALSPVEKAARIIYLNKTCYNGLFRVNSKSQFNVPYGKYKNPNILDEAVLKSVSHYLNKYQIEILEGDFEKAVIDAKEGDFIYLDPPYDPVSDTASFTSYYLNGFNKEEQKRLKEVFDNLHEKGCYLMLSNSRTDFILKLYANYKENFQNVTASRNINSKACKRGKVDEILILNYKPEES